MKYQEYLKDKRVILVGPAPYILNQKMYDLIDSYDVVVRINRGLQMPDKNPDDFGSRTDVYYHCMSDHPENGGPFDYELMQKQKVKHLRAAYPPLRKGGDNSFNNVGTIKDYQKFRKHFNSHKTGITFTHLDKNFYLGIEKKMGSRPNSGICAILDILECDVKELYITGITFFKGGYCSEYRSSIDNVVPKTFEESEQLVMTRLNRHGKHNLDQQIEVMANVLLNNPKVKLDQELVDILMTGMTTTD